MAVGIRHSCSFIKKSFGAEGYILVSDTYINNKQKLKYICPEGHSHSITWDHWKQGCRCAVCAKNIKHTLNFVRGSFEGAGYCLITDHYINQKQKLEYICSKGHKHTITWTDWYNGGYRCPTCWRISMYSTGNHQWKGGIAYEGYCPIWKDKTYKEMIKERDGRICLNPSCLRKNNELVVHHIDYNKKNCSMKNLITVCRVCNIQANKDRRWHTLWYKELLAKKYNYKY